MRGEKAIKLFSTDFNCSQSVLTSFAEELGLDEKIAKKIACGFGAGMGCTARTCGAVTGAFMVIGLKYGKSESEDKESKPQTYKKVKAFIEEFEKKNGSIECLNLLPIDIRTEKGMSEAREKGVFKNMCSKFVKDAVDILESKIFV